MLKIWEYGKWHIPFAKILHGRYVLFEIAGSGREIAEIERRFRVNDFIMRYITVRVDEERKTAAKTYRKTRRKSKRVTECVNQKVKRLRKPEIINKEVKKNGKRKKKRNRNR